MMNYSVLTPCFVFSFLFRISISTSTPRYIAVDNITLNCGTSGTSTDLDKREWIGDINSKYAPTEAPNHKSAASKAKEEGYRDAVPYQTARISFFQFTYQFRVAPGPKFLRLYFFNTAYQGFENSIDFFTVQAGSFVLLSNFSASLVKSSNGSAIYKEFCIYVGEEKKLNVTFIPCPSTSSKFYAFINGVEIVSMPNYLYYPEATDLPYVGQVAPFSFDYHPVLEMVVRLNVGGGDIPPVDDTGMYRKWSKHDSYFVGEGVNPQNIFLKPKYTKIPNFIAPDDVYKTAQSMGTNSTKNLPSNLTWQIPVDSGFDYLVRLHFCEIEPEVTGVGQRTFGIYIDNKTAKLWADVLEWSGRNETPVYKDYVVRIQDEAYLFVALHPMVPRYGIIDAILNGMEVFKLSNAAGNLAVAGPLPFSQKPATEKKTIVVIVGTCVGVLVVITLACGIVFWKLGKTKRSVAFHPLSKCWCWPKPDNEKSIRTRTSSLPGELCRHFTLEEIKRATENFKEELIIGVGGFGKVYKGLVNKGTTIVAIKRLNSESKQGFREFRTEIEMLSLLRHVHLVSLIGYCNDKGEKILVYDFMANGTLRQHLYDTHNDPLSWKQRLQICVGAARGLNYLHTGVEQPIIHRDVKTTNILLDDKWKAKVSDFGLSKTVPEDSAVSTMVKGTWGYLDPDYAQSGQLTVRSDVYSFGVVLLEVLCGRKALDHKLEIGQCNLANWAQECMERGTIGEIIDPYLKGKIAPECFKVYMEVAESCVREQGIQRPTMKDVKERLDFALKLQENADAEMEKLNSGGLYSYQEVLSFHIACTSGVPRSNNVHSEHGWETDSGTVVGTTNSGWTSSTLDSDAIASQPVYMDTTISKA